MASNKNRKRLPNHVKDIFQKYGINDSHSEWNPSIDNWVSVEVYRVMHDGNLPEPDNLDMQYVLDFLDKCDHEEGYFPHLMETRTDAGSLYLTARRMVYRYKDYLPKPDKEQS